MKNFARIYLDNPDRAATVTVVGAAPDGGDLVFTISGDGSLTLYDRNGGHVMTTFPYEEA